MFKYYKIASEDLEDPTVYDEIEEEKEIDLFASIREIKSIAKEMEEQDDDQMLYDESFED